MSASRRPVWTYTHLRDDDTAVMQPLQRGTRSDLLRVLKQTEGGVSAMVFRHTLTDWEQANGLLWILNWLYHGKHLLFDTDITLPVYFGQM